MCHQIHLLCACGHTLLAHQPIIHCPEGLKLSFSCTSFDPAAPSRPIEKDYDCGRKECCRCPVDAARRRLEEAYGTVATMQKQAGGEGRLRAAREEMERKVRELGDAVRWHEGCTGRREEDVQ